jgi:hypothetical protein
MHGMTFLFDLSRYSVRLCVTLTLPTSHVIPVSLSQCDTYETPSLFLPVTNVHGDPLLFIPFLPS